MCTHVYTHTHTGGLLKIEDVLPFFPDFVTIDNFKEAICDSLERYNRQVCVDACLQVQKVADWQICSLTGTGMVSKMLC